MPIGEMGKQLVEMLAARVIESIDGFPTDRLEKTEIAAEVAAKVAGADFDP